MLQSHTPDQGKLKHSQLLDDIGTFIKLLTFAKHHCSQVTAENLKLRLNMRTHRMYLALN